MEITLLIKSILGLIVILAILVFFLIFAARVKKSQNIELPEELIEEKIDKNFEHLKAIIDKRESTTEELADASSGIIKYYGLMPKKLGIRAHPDSNVYMDILFKLARHKNTNKTIVIKFNNDLEKLNPEYKKEISDALMRGLNSRGI